MNVSRVPSVPRIPLQEPAEKITLAVTVAVATVLGVLGYWLSLASPIVFVHYSLLVLLGAYLLARTRKQTTPVLGVLVSLAGLAVLGYGVDFSNVIAVATSGLGTGPWLPLHTRIHFGEGLTLRLSNQNYTYIVRTPAALLGYLLFVAGLYGTDFEETQPERAGVNTPTRDSS